MNRIFIAILYALIIIVCLVCSFFFSSADMAYGVVSLSHFDNDLKLNPNKAKKIKRAKLLASDYDKTISTILFGNDLVNACLDSVATLFGINLCLLILGEDATAASESWGLIVSMIVLLLKITAGEIVPKSIAKVKNYSMSLNYSTILYPLQYLFYIFTTPVSFFGKMLSKLFKGNVKDIEVNEDDLHEMIDDIEEKGNVDKEKASMLHDTINYTHKTANEIKTPRVDLIAIDIEDDIDSLIQKGDILKHSRIPVYENTIDNIIGFVQIKTLMIKYVNHKEHNLKDILIEPLRFPQSAEINDILREFKKTKKHFAIVMDEYGGVDGIITMEDILEEIVGEIWDENDTRSNPIVERKDGSYILDGSLTLEEFCDLFDIDYESINTDYLTIGGFIVELLDDKFAKINDEVDFEDVHIKVIAVDENDAVERLVAYKVEKEE